MTQLFQPGYWYRSGTFELYLDVNGWCKLDISLGKAKNIKRFKSILKDFFNLKQKSLFAIHDSAGVKLLSSLQLKFSHLNEHKFYQTLKIL